MAARMRKGLGSAVLALLLVMPSAAHASPYDDAFTQQIAIPDATSPAGTSANATADRSTGNLEVNVEARSALPAGIVVPFVNVGAGGATAAANAFVVDREQSFFSPVTATVSTSIVAASASAAATGLVVPGNTAASAGVSLVAVFQGYRCSSPGVPPCYGTGPYESASVPVVCAPYACAAPSSPIVFTKTVAIPPDAEGLQVVVYLSASASTQGAATASASTLASVTSITYA